MGFTTFFVVAVALAMLGIFIALVVRYRGKRIVTCPETHTQVGAKINAALAAGTWLAARPHFVITACSRWPERAGCDQACTPQIEASPDETLVRNIVAKWYDARTCIYCATSIGDIGFTAVAPAFLAPDGTLREWKDVAIDELPHMLENAVAVCARCELVEDFRRHFPNRGIERRETHPPRSHFAIDGPSAAIY